MELPSILQERLRALEIALTPRILVISVTDQKAALWVEGEIRETWPISTAKKGVGQKLNSFQTPLGLHSIKQKIGREAQEGTIYVSRESTGKIWKGQSVYASKDLITSRILWLEGFEPGFNLGKNKEGDVVDSFERYIYIHGTNHEQEIGGAASRGCVRMNNKDIISLFDLVEEGDLVWIKE